MKAHSRVGPLRGDDLIWGCLALVSGLGGKMRDVISPWGSWHWTLEKGDGRKAQVGAR